MTSAASSEDSWRPQTVSHLSGSDVASKVIAATGFDLDLSRGHDLEVKMTSQKLAHTSRMTSNSVSTSSMTSRVTSGGKVEVRQGRRFDEVISRSSVESSFEDLASPTMKEIIRNLKGRDDSSDEEERFIFRSFESVHSRDGVRSPEDMWDLSRTLFRRRSRLVGIKIARL